MYIYYLMSVPDPKLPVRQHLPRAIAIAELRKYIFS
jgi:hypothetical protein